MLFRTLGAQKCAFGKKTEPYENAKVAKKRKKVARKKRTKPYARFFAIFALSHSHFCAFLCAFGRCYTQLFALIWFFDMAGLHFYDWANLDEYTQCSGLRLKDSVSWPNHTVVILWPVGLATQ